MKQKAWFYGALVGAGAVLAGCGGGGGGGGSAPVATPVRLSINWSGRSGSVSATASSVTIVLKGASADVPAADFTWTINRDPSSTSGAYVSSGLARTGTWPLVAQFYDQAGGGGTMLTSSQTTVTLNPDGSGISLPDGSISTSGGCGTGAFVPNYATDTDPQSGNRNVLYHWDQFPVRVYLDTANMTDARRAAMLGGFDWWAQSTGKVGAYTMVSDAGSAQIVIRLQYSGSTGFGGLTNYSFTGSHSLTNATITLNLTYLEDPSLLQPAAAHEFGHAMGIGGHSAANTDLMSFSSAVYNLSSPTQRDVNTIETAYCALYGRAASPAPAHRDEPIYSATIACPKADALAH